MPEGKNSRPTGTHLDLEGLAAGVDWLNKVVENNATLVDIVQLTRRPPG